MYMYIYVCMYIYICVCVCVCVCVHVLVCVIKYLSFLLCQFWLYLRTFIFSKTIVSIRVLQMARSIILIIFSLENISYFSPLRRLA